MGNIPIFYLKLTFCQFTTRLQLLRVLGIPIGLKSCKNLTFWHNTDNCWLLGLYTDFECDTILEKTTYLSFPCYKQELKTVEY